MGYKFYLEVINSFATSLLKTTTIDEILWEVAQNVMGKLGFVEGVIYLVDEKGEKLIQKAAFGPKSPIGYSIDNIIEIPIGKGITGCVAKNKKGEIVGDVSKDSRYILDDEQRASEMAIPIIYEDKVIGVIDSEHPEKDFFTQQHYDIVTTIASLIANKIIQAKALEELHAQQIKLKESEDIFRKLFEEGPVGIALVDPSLKIIKVNMEFLHMMKYTKDELMKLSIADFTHPDDIDKDIELANKVFKGEIPSYSIEKRYITKDNKVIWGSLIASIIRDENGNIVYGIGIVKDITQRKNAEEQLLLNQKELSDRNFELDQIIHKISHDIRAPLTSILGLVNVIKLEEKDENIEQYIDLIESRVYKLDDFVKSMLSYNKSSRTMPSLVPIGFNSLVDNCLKNLEYLPSFSKINIELNIKNQEKEYKSDPLQMQVIFSNLIANAYKFMNPNNAKSYLKIEISNHDVLNIIFTDNGIGIHEEHLKKIFNMFYRASHTSEGSGLGLYIVKQSVERLNGKIKIKSKLGEFTEVSMQFPKN